jgi:hypothetical protein
VPAAVGFAALPSAVIFGAFCNGARVFQAGSTARKRRVQQRGMVVGRRIVPMKSTNSSIYEMAVDMGVDDELRYWPVKFGEWKVSRDFTSRMWACCWRISPLDRTHSTRWKEPRAGAWSHVRDHTHRP